MPAPRQIQISAEQCPEFQNKFISIATQLLTSGQLDRHIEKPELIFKALQAYTMLCEKRHGFLLPEADVDLVLFFKEVIDHFAKPHQLPIFGGATHQKICEAKTYLEGLIPKEFLPPEHQI